jgi:hypothetical protein
MDSLFIEELCIARNFQQVHGEAYCFSVICEWTLEKNSFVLNQRGNADETPLYFDILSKYTVNEIGAKSMVLKTSSCEEMRATVMLAVLADGSKLPPNMF